MPWLNLMHLGDLSLTLPAAAAVTAWLVAARTWRGALCWCLLFGCAVGLVGASKIAFLGWGAGIPALGFKAISGHAMGATAVFPTVFHLLAQTCGRRMRQAALAAGLGLGAVVAVMLVFGGEHSAAEAAAGWAAGAVVSVGSATLTTPASPSPLLPGLVAASAAFAMMALLLESVSVNYWMARAALTLSGGDRLYLWNICG